MRKTAFNLMESFLRETQTRTRYEIYSEVAKKENFILISRTFNELANQKKEHANWLYQMLQQLKKEEIFEHISVEIKNPTAYGTTDENLKASIKEEDEGWQKVYPSFTNIAKIEGYKEISKRLGEISLAIRNHSQRLKMFLTLLEGNTEKTKISFWKCMSCGFEVAIDELPNDFKCPTCGHIKSYFQKKTLQLIENEISHQKKEIPGWVCMECGYEVPLKELPDNWNCASCGRSKAYFKRKTLKPKDVLIKSLVTEKANWICLECGHEEEIEMPIGWKCPTCGFPKK